MKKNILMIVAIFTFLTISAAGCVSTGKYSRTYIPPDSPFYDIPTIQPAPQHVVDAVLAADKGQTSAHSNQRDATDVSRMSARPNQRDYEQFKKRIAQKKAKQKIQVATVKATGIVATKKRPAFSKKSLETRLAKVERRVNYVISYSRENRNRIGLLEDRFNLSACGKIRAKLVLFKSGSAELSPEGKKVFDELVETGAENIIITAHASITKGKIDNKTLSQQRAQNAHDYLQNKDIEADIIVVGETTRYGENKNISVTWE